MVCQTFALRVLPRLALGGSGLYDRSSFASFKGTDVIRIIGGCGQMFEAIIVSPQFAKKTTLARHRLVNSSLKEEIAATTSSGLPLTLPSPREERESARSIGRATTNDSPYNTATIFNFDLMESDCTTANSPRFMYICTARLHSEIWLLRV